MHNIVKKLAKCRWFKDPSPFRCTFELKHPKICVITGDNVSGKSLVRKVLHNWYHEANIEYIPVSQAGRCRSGIERAIVYGDENEDSTGSNSVKTLLTAIKTGQKRDKPFVLMLDEPEIGCSEELQAGIGNRITRDIDTIPKLEALFVITHSRQVVEHLLPLDPTHLRLSARYASLIEWTTREVKPAENLDEISKLCHERWLAVEGIKKS